MDKTMLYSSVLWLKILLFLRMLLLAMGSPTLGHIDRERLETYEELPEESSDFDLFANLTFRFSCESKPIGLYADTDYDCRIFHVCDDSGNGFPAICPNNTLFDQKERVCVEEEHADCEHANEWFYLNELLFSTEATNDVYLDSRTEEGQLEADVPTVLPLLSP